MPAAQPLADNDYASFGYTVAEAQPSERVAFVRKTYTHLAVAVYAFAALEWVYFQSGIAEKFLGLLQGVPYAPLIMLGAFMALTGVHGVMEASATRTPETPRTRPRVSTTALASSPMRHVPA